MWDEIEYIFKEYLDTEIKIENPQAQSGGCINQSFRITNPKQDFFIKINTPESLAMFEAEAVGLNTLRQCEDLCIPKPLYTGTIESYSLIILEALEFTTGLSNGEKLGRGLAQIHRITNDSFGFECNNTIGSTPQSNQWHAQWSDFWIKERLSPQLQWAYEKGFSDQHDSQLIQSITNHLLDHRPQPSLVHGDLWSGNASMTRTGQASIYDPATYFGDRETDLAMTELFGGFPEGFYSSYQKNYPIPEGYTLRKDIYNLYHILNHFNLFGDSYRSQANHLIDRILKA